MERFFYYFQSVLWESYQSHLKNPDEKEQSLRGFAKKIGLNSGTLSLIFKGQRSLNNENAKKLAESLRLNDSEKKLFFRSIALYKARSFYTEDLSGGRPETFPVRTADPPSQEASLNKELPTFSACPEELRQTLNHHQNLNQKLSDLSSICIAVNPDLLPEAKEVIYNFKKEMSLLFEKAHPREHYLLCIQFFPLEGQKNKE